MSHPCNHMRHSPKANASNEDIFTLFIYLYIFLYFVFFLFIFWGSIVTASIPTNIVRNSEIDAISTSATHSSVQESIMIEFKTHKNSHRPTAGLHVSLRTHIYIKMIVRNALKLSVNRSLAESHLNRKNKNKRKTMSKTKFPEEFSKRVSVHTELCWPK